MANLKYEVPSDDATRVANVARVDMKLEVVVIPVSAVDRAKEFYRVLGHLRQERHHGGTWIGPGLVPDRLRP